MKLFGLMFHHFHDGIKHKRSEGSISKSQFKKILQNFKKNIVTPEEFINRITANKENEKKMICLTFDDGIKSQADIALEVLDDLKLKGFFFSNSFQYENKIGLLECCRYFRNNYFSNIEKFYELFLQNLKKNFSEKKVNIFIKSRKKYFTKWKKISPFYTYKDLEFRLLRDFFLNKNQYDKQLIELFNLKGFNYKKKSEKLHFSKKDLEFLSYNKHEIGLHSHSHPIPITDLSLKDLKNEYKKNYVILKKIIKKDILSMSHPNGYFDINCKKVLKNLGIKIGFANSEIVSKKKLNPLNIPRIDHTHLI